MSDQTKSYIVINTMPFTLPFAMTEFISRVDPGFDEQMHNYYGPLKTHEDLDDPQRIQIYHDLFAESNEIPDDKLESVLVELQQKNFQLQNFEGFSAKLKMFLMTVFWRICSQECDPMCGPDSVFLTGDKDAWASIMKQLKHITPQYLAANATARKQYLLWI